MEIKYYYCEHCHTLVEVLQEVGHPVCCGSLMTELKANEVDASNEKHLPVIKVDNNHVQVIVGKVEHPMLDNHYIMWIALLTKEGYQRKVLKPGTLPVANFTINDGDEVISAYSYCNLHSLWKTNM